MTQTESSAKGRSRVPNGTAVQRPRVALTEAVLRRIQEDAAKNMRTVSSMAAFIITKHYEAIDGRKDA